MINYQGVRIKLTNTQLNNLNSLSKKNTGTILKINKKNVENEIYTNGWLLDYEYIKNHYRLIAIDLSRQKELDVDRKSIQQIEFVGQLKKLDDDGNDTDVGNDQSMFVLKISEKNFKKRDKSFCKEV